MKIIGGKILTENGTISGYIKIEKNNKKIELGKPPIKPEQKGLIVPNFINSHTHIGDSFIKNKNIILPNDIKKLVAPPNGIKHRMLNKATDEEIITGIKKSVQIMIKSGTKFFWDFREGGLTGIELLKKAINNIKIRCLIMSRPKTLDYDNIEIKSIINSSNGIGISSISDWDYEQLQKISKITKSKGKLFALHASERTRENIDKILDLKPNYLIHMNQATKSDLTLVKEAEIPIIICPRSNNFFGLKLNIKLLNEIGINLMLGTDNAMINNPNVLEEIKFLKTKYQNIDINELIKMITYNPRKALNLECDIPQIKSMDEIIVLDKNLNIIYNH
jgi:cytosine/adenosine deaminase-related metal-dependent hydrolase